LRLRETLLEELGAELGVEDASNATSRTLLRGNPERQFTIYQDGEGWYVEGRASPVEKRSLPGFDTTASLK
jgi:hypothetical protein